MGISGIRTLYVIEDEVQLMPDENFDSEDVQVVINNKDVNDGPGFSSSNELPASDFVENDEESVK